MNKSILTILGCCLAAMAFAQNSLNGVYVGLEEMCSIDKNGKKDCYIDPGEPWRKWYHLSRLKIKGDSVYMDQSPVHIYKKDTLFSSSDGVFYYYRGTMSKNDTAVIIDLKLYYCDYCATRIDTQPDGTRIARKSPGKHYIGRLKGKDILINNYLFKRVDFTRKLNSEKANPNRMTPTDSGNYQKAPIPISSTRNPSAG